jgi:hypothetical protein
MPYLFVTTVVTTFVEHGSSALQAVCGGPVTHLGTVAAFIPRELIMQREAERAFDAMLDGGVREEIKHESRKRILLDGWQKEGDRSI